jgi:cytoskeletal protein CcmA (bactofilin family)
VWTKQQPFEPSQTTPGSTPATSPAARVPISAASPSALIGPGLTIKGHVTGSEDLQIDGKVDGPISLVAHELTVGPNAQVNSEIDAGAVIVYGKIVGNVQARNRVDIKRDGSVIGDISTARISIEDGAHFKGRIEIDPAKSPAKAV